MNIFICCIPLRKKIVDDDFPEYNHFERFSDPRMSVRRENLKSRNVTGMSKFRASQKLKRRQENLQCKTLPKPKNEIFKKSPRKRPRRSLSQPTLTVKNYVPYDY